MLKSNNQKNGELEEHSTNPDFVTKFRELGQEQDTLELATEIEYSILEGEIKKRILNVCTSGIENRVEF